MAEDLSLAPFRIHTRDDGTLELWLFDGDMEEVEDVFAGLGAESNGHGWEGLAWWLTHTEMPDLADPVWFSSEGGTFVAGSSDPAALRRLAERLHSAFHDRSLLAHLITAAELD
jgi:Immunity protein 51